MGALDHCHAGVNLGGWISQYAEYHPLWFRYGVQEKDIAQIASWGMDHIRLPVDYPVIMEDSDLSTFKEDGLSHIDDCLSWCQRHGLSIVLDLHRAPGYRFMDAGRNPLLHDRGLQDVFVNIWRSLAQRYASVGDELVFELLNEVVEQPPDSWYRLARRAIAEIHAVTPGRVVLLGGVQWNSIFELKNLPILDGAVEYTFHFYETTLFTHQFAWWANGCIEYGTPISYPGGEFPRLAEFLDEHPEHDYLFRRLVGRPYDRDQLLEDLAPALRFARCSGHTPYCGEFGVYAMADGQSRLSWLRDVVDFFNEHRIGHAVWTYRGESFGLVNLRGEPYSEELIEVVSAGW